MNVMQHISIVATQITSSVCKGLRVIFVIKMTQSCVVLCILYIKYCILHQVCARYYSDYWIYMVK